LNHALISVLVVVDLASWQGHGLSVIRENNASDAPRLLMSEFNSASCGGVVGISDTFGVGALWTVDYVLQMASMGYVAAYIHTRERGVSYNLIESPLDTSQPWLTYPTFYSVLAVAELLDVEGGSIVVDLDIEQSRSTNASSAGYGVYDTEATLQSIALFNYSNDTKQFALEDLIHGQFLNQAQFPHVRFLSAPSLTERYNVSWAGKTFEGSVGDGNPILGEDWWAFQDQELSCNTLNCGLDVPGPSLAVIFLNSGKITFCQIQSTV
jgi:hypothetical protein